ncbi:phage tail tube protein [Kitasatospora sp. NPDC002965]|uniref:phage tail tube protein n=1 Tax=Kitasatospora sp. NPDC002965 TaxID=3154775 RepID=UPI0033B4B41A
MSAIDGFGTKLKRGDGGSPQNFTEIGEITQVGGPSLSRETYESTTHGSPFGWRTFIGGLKDGGEVSADVNYDPSVHDILAADFEDKDPRDYQLVFPDPETTTWTFEAILTGLESSAPFDDKLTATLGWKVSGKPTLG